MHDYRINTMSYSEEQATEVGARIVTLTYGYYSHAAAIDLGLDARVTDLIEREGILDSNLVGSANRKIGKGHAYSKLLWLKNKEHNKHLMREFERVWLSGVLITIGDMLHTFDYFDRSPNLEFIRHLRNAVAHNNRFRIDHPHKLKKYPAHNKNGKFRGWNHDTAYEITEETDDCVLMWEFMGPGDIMDALLSAGFYLMDGCRTVSEGTESGEGADCAPSKV